MQNAVSRVLYNLATTIAERVADMGRGKVTPPAIEKLEEDPQLFTDAFLSQVYRALEGRNLVLLLDEFDVLGNSGAEREDLAETQFFPFLQTVVNRDDKLFLLAVVGRRLDEVPKLLSLFHGAPLREIGPLDKPSATRLITEPTAGILRYDADAIEAILELSAGHPYFTQVLCHVLFARARTENRSRITRADVEGSVNQAIEQGEAGLQWFRDGLLIPERVMFSAVAEAQERERSAAESGGEQARPGLWEKPRTALSGLSVKRPGANGTYLSFSG